LSFSVLEVFTFYSMHCLGCVFIFSRTKLFNVEFFFNKGFIKINCKTTNNNVPVLWYMIYILYIWRVRLEMVINVKTYALKCANLTEKRT